MLGFKLIHISKMILVIIYRHVNVEKLFLIYLFTFLDLKLENYHLFTFSIGFLLTLYALNLVNYTRFSDANMWQ